MTIARQLADWSSELAAGDIPEPVTHAASRHLLDGIGTALAARRDAVVEPALALAASLGGPPEAAVIGSPLRISAPAAAFANGALVHGLDFDDTHGAGLVHATAVVLPAAFAVGAQTGASGQQVLTAAVAGYETVCRIAMASPYGFHARGLHATSVAGVFSAAAVTAHLLRLSPSVTTHALGIAGSSAGGLLEFLATGASTKQLHPGSASMSGILAARLAAAGATGPESVLEGPHGVYAAMAARPADAASVTAGLGDSWEVTRITIKQYPSCQLIHSTLDAAAKFGQAVDPEQVEQIIVRMHPDALPIVCAPVELKVSPRNSYDAKFSLQWSLAAVLIDGKSGMDTYHQTAREEVSELARKIRIIPSAGTGSAADAAGHVEVSFRGGRVIAGEVARSHGSPACPLSDSALLAKFLGNTGDTALARRLADRVIGLAGEPDLTAITDLAAKVGQQ